MQTLFDRLGRRFTIFLGAAILVVAAIATVVTIKSALTPTHDARPVCVRHDNGNTKRVADNLCPPPTNPPTDSLTAYGTWYYLLPGQKYPAIGGYLASQTAGYGPPAVYPYSSKPLPPNAGTVPGTYKPRH